MRDVASRPPGGSSIDLGADADAFFGTAQADKIGKVLEPKPEDDVTHPRSEFNVGKKCGKCMVNVGGIIRIPTTPLKNDGVRQLG